MVVACHWSLILSASVLCALIGCWSQCCVAPWRWSSFVCQPIREERGNWRVQSSWNDLKVCIFVCLFGWCVCVCVSIFMVHVWCVCMYVYIIWIKFKFNSTNVINISIFNCTLKPSWYCGVNSIFLLFNNMYSSCFMSHASHARHALLLCATAVFLSSHIPSSPCRLWMSSD